MNRKDSKRVAIKDQYQLYYQDYYHNLNPLIFCLFHQTRLLNLFGILSTYVILNFSIEDLQIMYYSRKKL